MHESVDKLMTQALVNHLRFSCRIPDAWFPETTFSFLEDEDRLIPRQLQNKIFEKTISEFGAEVLVDAAESMTKMQKSPWLFALLNVDSPVQAVLKLDRLKQYIHAYAQIRIVEEFPDGISVCHFFRGSHPHQGENFFTFGAVKTLLTGVGYQQISCQWKSVSNSDYLEIPFVKKDNPTISGETIWMYTWKSFQPTQRYMEGLDDVLLEGLDPVANEKTTTAAVQKTILKDLSLKWSLNHVSKCLFISVRTLQRKLKAEGESFTHILHSTRISQAKNLLKRTEFSITEIGFLLGFADSAHFTREFKKDTGQTPSMFRLKYTSPEL